MILAVDTKDRETVIVTLKNSDQIVDTLSEKNEFGSQILLPLIINLMRKNQVEFKDLTAVETEVGPGSYTGLKVGAAVVQAIGFALNIPVNGELGKPVEITYS